VAIEQIVCPRCGGIAHINISPPPKSGKIVNASACPHCGYNITVEFYPDGSRHVRGRLENIWAWVIVAFLLLAFFSHQR
jgi:DNA-directed RNA polymerase subunit RPC12/RpoP